MLVKLSIRNARRQVGQYSLYIVSLIFVFSIIYSFNALAFSDAIVALNEIISVTGKNELGHMIIIFSALIVIVLGWFIGYMINFMIRKRSSELSTYMILGIEKKQIIKLFVFENVMIGLAVLIMGWGLGIFISNILESIVINIYESNYKVSPGFSIKAALISVLYFSLVYIIALFVALKKFSKIGVIELLHYKETNEIKIGNSYSRIFLFVISFICGGIAIYFFSLPNSNVLDSFIGIPFVIIGQMLFYVGLPFFLLKIIGDNREWKYKKTHLFLYRILSSKLRSISKIMGIVTALLTISIVCVGMSFSFYNTMTKTLNEETFDFSLLHMGEVSDFNMYREYLDNNFIVKNKHYYPIYTQQSKYFMDIRNDYLDKYLERNSLDLQVEDVTYSETQYDMYIRIDDYNVLRQMNGLDTIELNDNEYMIHCMPYLANVLDEYTNEKLYNILGNRYLKFKDIYKEEFSQYKGYGNGQELIIVVPNDIPINMDVVYSLLVVDFDEMIDNTSLQLFKNSFPELRTIDFNMSKSIDNKVTLLDEGHTDYLSGLIIKRNANQNIIFIVPVFYTALIAIIIGIVILIIQLLSESSKYKKHYHMLLILGMSQKKRIITLKKQCILYFIFPLCLSLLFGGILVAMFSYVVFAKTFEIPITNIHFLITEVTLASLFLVSVIYIFFGVLSYSLLKKEILEHNDSV